MASATRDRADSSRKLGGVFYDPLFQTDRLPAENASDQAALAPYRILTRWTSASTNGGDAVKPRRMRTRVEYETDAEWSYDNVAKLLGFSPAHKARQEARNLTRIVLIGFPVTCAEFPLFQRRDHLIQQDAENGQ